MQPHQDGGTIFSFFVKPDDIGRKKYQLERESYLLDKKFNQIEILSKTERVFILSLEPVHREGVYYIYAESAATGTKGFVPLRHIRKPTGKEKTKTHTERQERSIVSHINDAVARNSGKPIMIMDRFGNKIKNVIGAKKVRTTSNVGQEPLTDIIITTKTDSINVSMKSNTTPSLAGGGWKGLTSMDKALTMKIIKSVINWYKKNGYKEGDKDAPDVYCKIPQKITNQLIIGNTEVGGPIHFVYIGDIVPDVEYLKTKQTLVIKDGDFIPAIQFAKDSELYFRVRKRYAGQILDFTTKNESGIPQIFAAGKAGEENGSRISVSKYHPKTGKNTIELD